MRPTSSPSPGYLTIESPKPSTAAKFSIDALVVATPKK